MLLWTKNVKSTFFCTSCKSLWFILKFLHIAPLYDTARFLLCTIAFLHFSANTSMYPWFCALLPLDICDLRNCASLYHCNATYLCFWPTANLFFCNCTDSYFYYFILLLRCTSVPLQLCLYLGHDVVPTIFAIRTL